VSRVAVLRRPLQGPRVAMSALLHRHHNTLRRAVVTACGSLFAIWGGRTIALGGRLGSLVLVVSLGLLAASLVPLLRVTERLGVGYMAVEVPVLLLLASTLVFRIRDAEALASDPLDSAALFRVACIAAAMFLALMSLTAPHVPDNSLRSRPFRLYAAYILIVFVGAPLSVYPVQTAYRGIELAAGWLVIAAARRSVGREAVRRIERTLYWFVTAMVASVWLGVILFPSQAVLATDFAYGASPIPWQLQGVLPSLSSNGVGDIGATLFLWSLVYVLTNQREAGPSRRTAGFLTILGLITLIGAQYRTGYVGAAVGFAILMLFRKRGGFVALTVALVMVAGIWGSTLISRAQPYVLRGQNIEAAATLSGRFDWWEPAIAVWEKSPLVGRGLLTATRYEVLEPLGRSETSTIHSTWIESLVGTGVLGTASLALALLIGWRRAIAEALSRGGAILPLVLLLFMTIRSVTGTTFETFGIQSVLFLWLVLALPDAPQRKPTSSEPLLKGHHPATSEAGLHIRP
jgi:O-antigen ligase